MKKTISMLLSTGLLATGCSSLPPMKGNPWDRDVNYAIEDGRETENFESKSAFTVILLPDDHYSYGCQANTYLTLEKFVLSGEVKFVAREGRVGPTEHNNKAFKTMRYFDSELEVHHYKDFIGLSLDERKHTAHTWIQNHQFPSQYRHNMLADKPFRNWDEVLPMIATVLGEAVYQNKVQTIGVESQEALDKADLELEKAGTAVYEAKTQHPEDKKLQEEVQKAFLAVRDEQIKYRNAEMVANIQDYANKLNFVEGKMVLFPVGAMHVPDLTQRFRDKLISYKVIEHKACMEEGKSTLEDIY